MSSPTPSRSSQTSRSSQISKSSQTHIQTIEKVSRLKTSQKPLPRVALLKKNENKNPQLSHSSHYSHSTTSLPSGERIQKNHKCLTACGSIEEAIGLIGRLKSTHFNLDNVSARKMFIFARLTKIQEDLLHIIKSITTTPSNPSKHTNSRFPIEKLRELEDAIVSLNSSEYIGIPGTSCLESDIYCVWTLVRRCERQVIGCRDPSIGIIIDENVILYMNKLGTYFSHLIPHALNKY